ncbi:bifunctional 4-hydroxy-2-oxoglutarate aldolase/2-dehydro-3-deoxy-phosphogluconate aldolase [Ponticaulis sp.]|uniref:bifunctional 4-hydroxy-2-oxoglutarate aldolase/2-dehydro-3-deoxy-phosphogluconate aldolase n=1 Tax=Ponticaulis sp. TaxID=2020902 RepID=UPI000B631C5C|nr:bifunctional 4-hydroxy-2-oxoglutarate aldolase/2-dehydro-3-deoxy-phosphogluconate aldolase [Ponticaulis sp.]MAI91512.1 keto-deoxy-phosphogluconate aldolase [Ponticaulis sp.]OUX97475.1 MAG: hypothetical protein CBB65_13810 [Hyphomonadaceae bacterium TMED5]|tara:strand:- start:25254 stop:25904 length:651 start_codon:yes stop_codon:yes gene_type:complete
MSDITEQKKRIRNCGVVPVLTIESVADAVPLAEALMKGGLDVIEVTLRTAASLDAIKEIASSGLDVFVGAGTITCGSDVGAALKAGSEFLVTPATPDFLVQDLAEFPGLVVPGVATPTEALKLYDQGFDTLKFFPAEPYGGAATLKGLSAPLPNINFMPTGGVKPETMANYLKLPNVVAVGGSWLATDKDIKAGNWDQITALAQTASDAVKAIRSA